MTPAEIRELAGLCREMHLDRGERAAVADALELLLPIVEELAEVTMSGRVVALIMRAREALK